MASPCGELLRDQAKLRIRVTAILASARTMPPRRRHPRCAPRGRRVSMCSVRAGRLLSVNVGGPREIEWQGKTVRTAIWRGPFDGPRMVRRINIDGDDQADRLAHGGEHRAVFVDQIDSYRYWERELERDDFT